jgi:hypothetical protein
VSIGPPLQSFSAWRCFCDGSGFGEGAPYLGAKKIKTGPGGTVTFSVKLKTSGSVSRISATATDPAGNTSEFSPCVP